MPVFPKEMNRAGDGGQEAVDLKLWAIWLPTTSDSPNFELFPLAEKHKRREKLEMVKSGEKENEDEERETNTGNKLNWIERRWGTPTHMHTQKQKILLEDKDICFVFGFVRKQNLNLLFFFSKGHF